MAVSELDFDELQRRYPGITREDADGKTEAEIKHDWFQKKFEQRYFSNGYLEMRENMGPALDAVLEILAHDKNAEKKDKKTKGVFAQLRKLSHDVRDAQNEKLNAELEVCSYDVLPGKHSCINCINIMDDNRPLFVRTKCESFNPNDFCENTQCHMFLNNVRYIKARTKYELARNARREFIKGIFMRSK